MSIYYNEQAAIFHLQAANTSYILQVHKEGYLVHLYWGRRIKTSDLSHAMVSTGRAFSPNPIAGDDKFSLDTLPQEYPAYGNSDFRVPAFQLQQEDGATVTNLRYAKHRIFKGKPELEGLPATYTEADGEAETLELELRDPIAGLRVILTYTAFEKFDAITRSVRFINEGKNKVKLLRALSMSVDFDHSRFDLLQLSGAWGRERHVERRALTSGSQLVESRRGASSHQQNPFFALLSKEANEDYGEAYGFNLVYSGNFLAQAEVDQFRTTRVVMGINPFDFNWLLEPGEHFQTPEVVMVYSHKGIGEMSRTYHKLYRTRLCRGNYRDKERPVLINNWEATYFNFTADKIENIARTAKELGIELFVLDDGWFGKRDDDHSSLGDWFVDKKKLPGGLEDLVQRVNNLGLRFGLWFEPEMVSPDSDLFRAHPDWCLHVPNRSYTEGRNQLVLDMSRKDVCEAVITMVSDILACAPISYVKWDMNRHMTEVGSALLAPERQRETAHRYILGVYRVMDEITRRFPDILFESCSGGGGRFDPGILYYMPQTWTSDNTDAVERLKIQYGTSIVYPASSMGSHVSAIPNHQVHRVTPLKMRGDVAISGNFGYELDLTKFTPEEMEIVKAQVALCKEIRHITQFGDMYRILSPFEGNETAWMFVTEDKAEAFVAYFRVMAEPNGPNARIRLKGLDPENEYRLIDSGKIYGGDELMFVGINIPDLHGDFQSVIWRFEAVNGQARQ